MVPEADTTPDATPPAPPAGKTYTEADIAGLRTKNQELLDKLAAAKPWAPVLGDRTPEQVKADLELAQQAREAKAKAEGDFESLKKQMGEAHGTEKKNLQARIEKLERNLYDVHARRSAEAAIVAAGGNPKLLLPHLLPFVRADEDGDDFVPRVVDAKGQTRVADGQGKPMTIEQLVETFKADDTYGAAFAPSGASGSGARNNAGGPGGGAGAGAVVIPRDATPQEFKRMVTEAEKAGRPFVMAQR